MRRGGEGQVEAGVVFPGTYFQAILRDFDGYDFQKDEFCEMCLVYLKPFGCGDSFPSAKQVLFSARDIPVEPGLPHPEEVARRIRPPDLGRTFTPKGEGMEWWIPFEGVVHTWDLYPGALTESRFEIDGCEDSRKSKVRVTQRTLAEHVGSAIGLK